MRWNSRGWARLEYAGSIELKNTREEEVEVRVRVRLRGKIDVASDQASVRKLHPGPRAQGGPDPLTEVTWTLTLGPGESVEQELVYHSHV